MYNPNTFFLNLKQLTVVKAVEDALRHIKMYVAWVSVKTEGIFQKGRGTGHSTLEQGLEPCASKTKKHFLKNSTIGNRLMFNNSNWCLVLPQSNFFLVFKNNFTAKFWRTFYLRTFAPTFFLKLLSYIHYINLENQITDISVKTVSKLFTRRDFLRKVGSF